MPVEQRVPNAVQQLAAVSPGWSGTNPGTANPPVPGMSGNVVFVQTQIGRKQGALVVKACAAAKLNPCKVGYLYSVKVSSLDTAIRKRGDPHRRGQPRRLVTPTSRLTGARAF